MEPALEPGPALEAVELTRRFGELVAVDRLSLALRRGELLALLGPNGAGKTTLMRMLCGLLRPDGGALRVLGGEGRSARANQRRKLGYCPQALVIWRDLTPLEQLTLMGEMFDLPRAAARRRATELLAMLGLEAKAASRAQGLSGGMKRRLNIALALVHDPALVILDEPAAGLDPQSRVLVRTVITSLAREAGKAVLVSTHDMDEAERLADRVAVMDQGRLIALDTPDGLKACGDRCGRIQVLLPGLSAERIEAVRAGLESLGRLAVRTEDSVLIAGDATLAEAVRGRLAELGVEPRELRFRQRTLEDVFIELTGRRVRD
jgi:ABC-2 type transport system ATP-binding protein